MAQGLSMLTVLVAHSKLVFPIQCWRASVGVVFVAISLTVSGFRIADATIGNLTICKEKRREKSGMRQLEKNVRSSDVNMIKVISNALLLFARELNVKGLAR